MKYPKSDADAGTMLNVHDAKTHLSRYLARVEDGETIVLCRRNHPIAELRPVRRRRTSPRPIGLDSTRFKVDAAFFDELPEDVLQGFDGT